MSQIKLYFTQPLYTDTGQTSYSTDPVAPSAWNVSQFLTHHNEVTDSFYVNPYSLVFRVLPAL